MRAGVARSAILAIAEITCPDPAAKHGHCLQSQEEDRPHRSGLKRARQDVKLNAANTALRSRFRTVIKNVQKAVAAGDKEKAPAVQAAQKVIDSVADKGLFHKNKAARHKSRLVAKIKALAAAA